MTSQLHEITFGLVAHDAKKQVLCDWAGKHADILNDVQIYATGTTGTRLAWQQPEFDINCLKSGPYGGDQQLGALICQGGLDALIFFIDPLSPHPHDVDVKALIRLATLYNIPYACNESTASIIAASFKANASNKLRQSPTPLVG